LLTYNLFNLSIYIASNSTIAKTATHLISNNFRSAWMHMTVTQLFHDTSMQAIFPP